MKMLVPFKRVPDPAGAAGPGGGGAWIVNPFDEIAIEEALRIRERSGGGEVVAVTVAPAPAEEQVRVALAMGADRAIRVDDGRALDPYAVARILRAVAEREKPDLVLMGKQAIDDDANQVGQMLAGLLGWPQATFASSIEFPGGTGRARCGRETDRGIEVIDVQLPAVVTADLRLNEPRYVSLAGLMKARRRPIEVLASADIAPGVEPRTAVLGSAPAPRRSAGIRVESVEELLARLREAEKVL
jgi:electron transfer flavoprotein beta subunit